MQFIFHRINVTISGGARKHVVNKVLEVTRARPRHDIVPGL